MNDIRDTNGKSCSESDDHPSAAPDMNESQTSSPKKERSINNHVKFSPFFTIIGEDKADDSKYAGDESMAMSAIFGFSSDDSISWASKASSTQQGFQASIDMNLVRQQQQQNASGSDESSVSTATNSVYLDAVRVADESVQVESSPRQGQRQPIVEADNEAFDGNNFQSFGSFSFGGSTRVAQDSVASFAEKASYSDKSLKEPEQSFSVFSLLGVARSVASVQESSRARYLGSTEKCSRGTAATAGGLVTVAAIAFAVNDGDDDDEDEGQHYCPENDANHEEAARKEECMLQDADVIEQGGDEEDQSSQFSSSEQEDDESTVDVAEQTEKQARRTLLSAILLATGMSIVGGWLATAIYRFVHRNDNVVEEEAMDAVAHGAVEGASNGFVQIGPGALQQSQVALMSQSTSNIGSTTGAAAAMQGGTQ
jgi:hypothetical protein